jgi:serine/threonine protein phosphatase PrpC
LGDSRVYRIRENSLTQLTNDHSTYQNNKEVLSKAIGNFDIFNLDINIFDMKKGDIILICSDGVYNFVQECEMLELKNSLDNYCEMIKKIIYQNGAKDNLTLIVVEVK